MPSGCCSNCRAKYSFVNPENGCSSCAFSFCSKCIGYKAMMPRLADKPVSVCYSCYQKLNDQKVKQPVQAPSIPPTHQPKNMQWWGNDLPPPSLRQPAGNARPLAQARRRQPPQGKLPQQGEEPALDSFVHDYEKRLAALKENEVAKVIPTVEEIENRLAALRECDVELVRNPRFWFNTTTSDIQGNDPLELMKNAKARAQMDDHYDPDNVIQRRFNELKEGPANDAEMPNDPARMSMISGATDFSEATQEELEQINKLMSEAEKSVKAAEEQLKDDASVQKELTHIMARARQKSLDVDKTNNQVQQEFSRFWDRQAQKQENMDNSDDEVDDEMIRKIVAEAEVTPDEPPPPQENSIPQKKKNFFNKLFKR